MLIWALCSLWALFCFPNKLALQGHLNPSVGLPAANTPFSLEISREHEDRGQDRLTSASAPAGPAILVKASSSRRDLWEG